MGASERAKWGELEQDWGRGGGGGGGPAVGRGRRRRRRWCWCWVGGESGVVARLEKKIRSDQGKSHQTAAKAPLARSTASRHQPLGLVPFRRRPVGFRRSCEPLARVRSGRGSRPAPSSGTALRTPARRATRPFALQPFHSQPLLHRSPEGAPTGSGRIAPSSTRRAPWCGRCANSMPSTSTRPLPP